MLALLAMMDMDIIFGQVAKYGTYNTTKSSLHNRYTRVMKAMLPRKRTSNLRILQNRGWNQEEDSCYIRITHFSKLDFCNEINDNSLNEAIALNQLKKDLLRITNAPDVCPTIDDLTPPATPFGSSVSFLYDSSPILSNVLSLTPPEALPLTPATPSCESHVFTFQESHVPQPVSISDSRALLLQSLMT